VKPREIRDDEGEEEVGWVITNSKVDDFLNKGDILLGQAMQALRHRHDSVRCTFFPPPQYNRGCGFSYVPAACHGVCRVVSCRVRRGNVGVVVCGRRSFGGQVDEHH
jgi:hypothetical protein